jgi:hypothetical protein
MTDVKEESREKHDEKMPKDIRKSKVQTNRRCQ